MVKKMACTCEKAGTSECRTYKTAEYVVKLISSIVVGATTGFIALKNSIQQFFFPPKEEQANDTTPYQEEHFFHSEAEYHEMEFIGNNTEQHNEDC